jgi:hypothetical protein
MNQIEYNKRKKNLISAMVFYTLMTIGLSCLIVYRIIVESNTEGGVKFGIIFIVFPTVIFLIALIYTCSLLEKAYYKYRNKQPNVESQPLIGPFPNNLDLHYPPLVSKNLSKNVYIHVDNPSLTLNKI